MASFQRATSSGQISSGALRVFGMHVVAAGANCQATLYDGTSTAGTLVIQDGALAGQGNLIDFGPVGITFKTGCYASLDGNTTYVTVIYEKV